MRLLLTFVLSCCSLLCLADEVAPSLSVLTAVTTRQTDGGSSSRLQAGISALYPTAYGALYWQDGEGGLALPAPGGWLSLGVANEPIWSLGAVGVSQNLAVARYGVDLPGDGALSVGYADRIGSGHPGQLIVANLDARLATLGADSLRLWGWASLADRQRRQSLDHDTAGGEWSQEQSNLLLVWVHPFAPHWALDLGAGSRWGTDQNAGHTAGWQTLVGVTWSMDKR
jgi:hypothetical protein